MDGETAGQRVSESPSAAIIVVHFGDPAPTLACLSSIVADPSIVNRTVVVADNSGNFRVPPSGVTVIPYAGNLGFGAAVNRGVTYLEDHPFDFYVVLNNDIQVRPGFLQAAANAFRSSGPKTAIAAGPLYCDPGLDQIWYAGGGINFLTGTVRQSKSSKDAHIGRFVGFVPGAAFAIRPSAWNDVGGFDPAYFLYSEDVDLCLRLRQRGWRFAFEPEMQAIHTLGQATGSQVLSPTYLYYMTRNRLRPFQPTAYRVYLAILHSCYVLTRAAFVVLRNGQYGRAQARALLSGHSQALAHLFGKNRPQPVEGVPR